VEAIPEAPRASTLPVTVLTGFLGSGKTTILARLLRDPRFTRTAVIINEFGEVGLDHELIEQSREELVLLSNGCVCCTVRGDLLSTLRGIDDRRAEFEIDRVVVETTGLADPAPILHSLMADPSITARFTLDHLVTTVDAFNGLETLSLHAVARSQAAMADRLVLTKLDLVSDEVSSALRDRLRSLNQFAPQHGANHGAIDPEVLFRAREWLRADPSNDPWFEQLEHLAHEHSDDHEHDHEHHLQDQHDSDIESYSIIREEPIPLVKFESWLRMITAMRGADLLRVKGIVNVLDHPDRPVVIHGVQHIFHPPRVLDKWPGADRRTRLVFITRNIARDDIDATLQVF
jgi:G3E family GTPase